MYHPNLLYYPTPSNPTDMSIAILRHPITRSYPSLCHPSLPSHPLPSYPTVISFTILPSLLYYPLLCHPILLYYDTLSYPTGLFFCCTILRYPIILFYPSLCHPVLHFYPSLCHPSPSCPTGPSFTPQLSTVLTAAKASGQVKSIKSLKGV